MDAAISAICDFPALVELELFGSNELITVPGLARIGRGFPNLLKLWLPDALENMDEVLKAVVKGCPKLQGLSIQQQGINLGTVVNCTSLTSLSINFGDLHGPHVLSICRANKDLKELLYTDLDAILPDHVIEDIIAALQLEKFFFAAGRGLSPLTLQRMASCRTLQHLTLENVETDCLTHFGQFRAGLQSLALRHCHGLESMQLKSIVSLNQDLRLLDVSGCSTVGSRGFSAIAQCRHLEVLDLSCTQVNDDDLFSISEGVEALIQLKLNDCSDVYIMVPVAGFTTLERLEVQGCQFVSDRWLKCLPLQCRRLSHLDVSCTDVSDKGIRHLYRCSLLRTLDVDFCKFVRGPGLDLITKKCLFLELVTVTCLTIGELWSWRSWCVEFCWISIEELFGRPRGSPLFAISLLIPSLWERLIRILHARLIRSFMSSTDQVEIFAIRSKL